MTTQYGAHEMIEIHEVLTAAINGINQLQLYRPHVRDQQLATILNRQVQFMNQEYNNLVQSINHQGISPSITYGIRDNISPSYGLDNPQRQAPNTTPVQLDDRDISSGMLGCFKSSAILKMSAALECADPNLRRMIQQSAVNCAEMGYEIWQYMNQKGYYQVPAMKEKTAHAIENSYDPSAVRQENPEQGQNPTDFNM